MTQRSCCMRRRLTKQVNTTKSKEVIILPDLKPKASDIDSNTTNYLPSTSEVLPMTPNTKAFATGDINIREARRPFSPN